MQELILTVLVLATVWAMVAVSLNLLAGWLGVLSLFHAALMGIGAYVAAILTVTAGFHWLLAVVIAMVVAAMAGAK